MESMKAKISELAQKYYQSIIEYRRYIHKNPELSFQESGTANYIKSIFEEKGIEVIPVKGQTSFFAVIKGSNPGKTIGIRAELDGLPVNEETSLDFKSVKSGAMHACGHDIHMASLIGTGIIIDELKEYWSGRVVLIFESGEEQLPGGAKAILESEEFSQYRPDLMIGMHVLPELEAGKVGFCSGRYMASGDEVYITVKGKGGHAALPHTLVDPVVIAASIIINLQAFVSRNSPALVPTVLSFGKVIANGATNIIPNEVSIEGTFRTMDETWRSRAHTLIESYAKGIAQSMGGECIVEIRKGYPSVYNNPQLTEVFSKLSSDFLGHESVVVLEPRMTTDDFAYFSQQIPSVFFRIGVGFPNSEHYQLHSSQFIANEEVIKHSVPLLVMLLVNNLR